MIWKYTAVTSSPSTPATVEHGQDGRESLVRTLVELGLNGDGDDGDGDGGGLGPSAELRAGSTLFGRVLIILQYRLSLACLLLLQ